MEKSGTFFSKGVHAQFKNRLKSIWGLNPLPQNTKYLGVPLFLLNNKKKDFSFVKEKLEARTSSWKCKALSWMGRTTLIKSVSLAISSYTMTVGQLSRSFCEEMDSILKRFWWGPKKESFHYYAPTAWSKLCTPKNEGSLRFRNFYNQNIALLTKLAWWVLTNKDSPCVKLLISKYRVYGNSLKYQSSPCASWTWKSIVNTRKILEKGACFLVGDGNSILVWEDPWIPQCPSFLPSPDPSTNSKSSLVVSQLLSHDKSCWDAEKLKSMFNMDTVKAIQSIPIASRAIVDKWAWIFTNNGEFSVKSAYRAIENHEPPDQHLSMKGRKRFYGELPQMCSY